MDKKASVGIIGGAGYTGGELIRLLLNHPYTQLRFIHSRSNAGKPIASVHQDLLGDTAMLFTGEIDSSVDVLFLCLGHGESRKFLQANPLPASVRIIDLANDFRLAAQSSFGDRQFVYGLPELNKESIRKAHDIANPGCFASSIQLGLLPLAKAGLLQDIYTTGITGSTGAGQSLSPTSHFSWRANNIQAYKTLTHQHLNEIQQSLHQLQSSFPANPGEAGGSLGFVPWRGDFTRGIFISSQIHCELSKEELQEMFENFYEGQPFTQVSREPIFLKQVVNSNKCVIQLEKVGSKLVIHSALDNLLKGASGQAIQNLNLMMGWDECAGLRLKAAYF
jgi:N-acetyl-gamma-glutamyl-phosphate reductase